MLCSWVSVSWCWVDAPSSQCYTAQRTEENVHTHVSVLQREGPGLYCFQQMGVTGVGKGVCVSVCVCWRGGCWSVFFLCLSTSELPLHLAASRTSAKMTEHTPLFTHSLYLSICVYLLPLSIFPLYLFTSSVSQTSSLASFFFFFCLLKPLFFLVLNPL